MIWAKIIPSSRLPGNPAYFRRDEAEAPKAPELRDLRIQQKLANTAEAREYSRSSRIQQKLANTAEDRDSEQKPQQRAEAPKHSRRTQDQKGTLPNQGMILGAILTVRLIWTFLNLPVVTIGFTGLIWPPILVSIHGET